PDRQDAGPTVTPASPSKAGGNRDRCRRPAVIMPGGVPATAVPGEPALRSVTRTWHLVPHDPAAIEHLARALGTSPVVAQLLLNRQQRDADTASAFLKAPLSGLHEPERLAGMPEAVERFQAAIQAK